MDVFAIEYGGGSLFGCMDVGGERGVSCSFSNFGSHGMSLVDVFFIFILFFEYIYTDRRNLFPMSCRCSIKYLESLQ